MSLVLLREIPEDEDLRRQWNALVGHMEDPQVFFTYEWALAVQRAYRETLRPLVYLSYEKDILCGVAALATNASGDQVSFLGATTGDYCDFLSVPHHRAAFVSAVVGALRERRVERMVFTNLPADSASVAAIRLAGRQRNCRCYARTAYVCAQVSLGRLERGQDGKLVAPGLKRLRRLSKAMGRQSPVWFCHSRTWDEVAPILPEFIQAHVARFLEIGRISNLANARRRLFLAELAKLLCGSQWFVLSRMMAGERALAWHYGFQSHGTLFWYQPTFDSSVEKHWPGFCLLSQVIQEASETSGLRTLDLGLGSEAYKAKFANQSRETLHVSLHSSPVKHCAAVIRYRVAETVRTLPAMEKIVEVARKELRVLRNSMRRQGSKQALIEAGRQMLRFLWKREEVFFFEWENGETELINSRSVRLCPLDVKQLALGAMEYDEDEATLDYLLRATRRLRAGGAEGFVLVDDAGHPLHFAWVAPLHEFYCQQLNAKLHGSSDSVILFDCWTPTGVRGQGNFRHASRLIAERIKPTGKRAWIFSAAGNIAAIKGLENSGFQRRYSLIRERIPGWQRTKVMKPRPAAALAAEVSAGV